MKEDACADQGHLSEEPGGGNQVAVFVDDRHHHVNKDTAGKKDGNTSEEPIALALTSKPSHQADIKSVATCMGGSEPEVLGVGSIVCSVVIPITERDPEYDHRLVLFEGKMLSKAQSRRHDRRIQGS